MSARDDSQSTIRFFGRMNQISLRRAGAIAYGVVIAALALGFAVVPAKGQDTIKVGILHSLSGTMAISESSLKDVMLMLIEEQNKKGGLLGKKLEAVVVDPASNWPLFAEKARELLARDKVAVVFGGWTSVSRKSVLPVFKELNGLLFYPVQYEGEESERNVFYAGATPNQQAIPAVDYLMNEEKTQRWVLEGTDYVYPRTTNKILEAYLKSKGVKDEDIMINYTPFGHSDFQSIVADIKKFGTAGKKTAVVSTINGDANVPFYKELSNQGIKATDIPVVGFSVNEEELAGIDTGPLVGHLAAWNYFESIDTPANKQFIAQWHAFTKNPKRVTSDPMEAHVIGFAMWVEAVKKAGSTDPDKVIDAIVGIKVPNLSGGTSEMLPNHHITKPVYIGEVRADGQFNVVWKTNGPVPGEAWSKYLPESENLIGDWTTLKCGNFNAVTRTCGETGRRVTPPAPDPHTVGLLFATTRGVNVKGQNVTLTDQRNAELTFGATRVRVPERHKLGGVERPWELGILGWTIYREAENDQQHFVVKATALLSRTEFTNAIRVGGRNQAVVFVHGFNTTFDEGAYRLAQIVWDSQFKGIPILFSWPSRGGILNYLYDQASATFSREGFLDLIQLLQRDTRITTIHVLAHSMGNQIVVDALANAGPNILAKPLGEVILAAPDVDWDVFTKLATKIVRTGRGVTLRGVTLYASSTDKALVASRKLAGGVPRAGDVLPEPKGPFVLKGIDTIDVSAIGDEMFGLNHNVFAAKRVLVDEIGRLMDKGDRPPSKRTPELRGFPEGADPPRYWRYPD